MASGNYQSQEITRAFHREQYAAGLTNRTLTLINKADRNMVAKLAAMEDGASKASLDRRLRAMRKQAKDLQGEVIDLWKGEFSALVPLEQQAEMAQMASLLGNAENAAQAGFNIPNPKAAVAAANSKAFKGPHLAWAVSDDHVKEYFRRKVSLVESTIRQGFVEGQGPAAIARTLRGTRANGFKHTVLVC